MTNNVGFTFSFGGIIPRFTISIGARPLDLVTRNSIFGVPIVMED